MTPLILLFACAQQPHGSYVPTHYTPSDVTRVVFMGDSITDPEMDAPDDEGLEEEAEISWRLYSELLVENDDAMWPEAAGLDLQTVFPNLEQVVWAAQAGSLSDEVAGEQLEAVAAAVGDEARGETLVVMTTGGNDMAEVGARPFTGRRTGASIAANIEAAVDFFEDTSRFPDGAYVYAGNLYDPTGEGRASGPCFPAFYGPVMDRVINNMNEALLESAQRRGYAALDIYGLFRDHGYGGDDPEEGAVDSWFYDCEHPDAEGHHELRWLYLDAILGVEPLDGSG